MADHPMDDELQNMANQQDSQSASNELPPPAPLNDDGVLQMMLATLDNSRRAGQITLQQYVSLVARLDTTATSAHQLPQQPEAQYTDVSAKLARAKATVHTHVPLYRGDSGDKITAGAWIAYFEREAYDAGLPLEHWPLSAVKRFPADAGAAMWANSVFGIGLAFKPGTWEDFRSAFLLQYTPPNSVELAQAAFERLSMNTCKGNIVAFNTEFHSRVTAYDSALQQAGLGALKQNVKK